ncbi:MAG: 1-acyl-sn-glycerol-3-phosphate acyltransferase [Chloroflexi bacterium]|nr:1-acyl-sn-glycerol-3-phosphate acyltransferase [Chloroflexota bacterium]
MMTHFETLTEINIDDMFDSVGLADRLRGNRLLRGAVWLPARGFARLITTFDKVVSEKSLVGGSEWLLKRVARRLEAAGRENVPPTGPALILSNHPGMADTISLFASLPRADLRVIANDRPFLQALPNVSRQMIYVPTAESADKMPVIRAAVTHLRQGGAVLTFPAGEIEPDPAVAPGAVESLQKWSESIALFARLAPQTRIIPAIVSGVVSAAAQHHPLTRLRRTPRGRERMAAMLQIMVPAYQSVVARVAFGPPLLAADLVAANPNASAITRAVTTEAQKLIESPPISWETLLVGDR